MTAEEFTFVFNGQTLKNGGTYVVDQYGNRFMIFTSSAGEKFKISRDDLTIDIQSGMCTQRHREISPIKV